MARAWVLLALAATSTNAFDAALGDSLLRSLHIFTDSCWRSGDVVATVVETDHAYGPAEDSVHNSLRRGATEANLRPTLYALARAAYENSYALYAGFEDATWLGYYPEQEGFPMGVALDTDTGSSFAGATVEVCDDAASNVTCPRCCRAVVSTDDVGAAAGTASSTYYDTTKRSWRARRVL